jgi:hypothetical protein
MRVLRYPAALVAVLALVALTAWALSWPFEKAVYLAPVIVVGGLAAVGSFSSGEGRARLAAESRHPRRVLATGCSASGYSSC